ncbi:MAG: phosphotransferase [Pseudorhodoplanes sp.]|uniref:phosphotransferase n=1 Tax=Pseudorhodoplanes sp. TaxID=1934341 RepID=UPI003D0D21FC
MRPIAINPPSLAASETVFVAAAQATPLREASDLAREHFGVSGSVVTLGSERDQNFHIRASNGREYILKIAHPAEEPDVTDLQTQILLHIAGAEPSLPVQRIVPAKSGAYHARALLADGSVRTIRLVTCLPGIPLHKATPSRQLRGRLGRSLAELDLVLKGFTHKAAKRTLMWNLSEAASVRDRLVHVSDAETRELALEALEHFARDAAGVLDGLPHQLIHCDFNPHNILVDSADHDRISGILDFGDALVAPRINDVAIAASYHLTAEGNPVRMAGEVVRSYHSRSPLRQDELEILPILIGARVAMTVAITAWRAELYPQNRDYILRNSSYARIGLRALAEFSPAQARDILHRASEEA